MALPGIGSIRLLVMGMRLEDMGFSRNLARANSRMNLMRVATTDATASVGLLRAQMAILGFTAVAAVGTMVKQFADFEKGTTVAALATGNFADNIGDIQKESLALARGFGLSVDAAVTLRREIIQLGVTNQRQVTSLAEASAMLAAISDVAAPDAAKAIFRLARLTARTDEQFNALISSSDLLASQILVVGNASSASVPGLINFLRTFELVGVASRFQTGELIALAGALATVDEQRKGTFTTNIVKILALQGEELEKFSVALGLSVDEVRNLQENDPVGLFRALFKTLESSEDKGMRLVDILSEMDIVESRSRTTLLGLHGAQSIFNDALGKSQSEFDNYVRKGSKALSLTDAFDKISGTLSFKWQEFGAALAQTAITVGGMLAPAVNLLLTSLTGLLDLLNRNPILLALLTGAAIKSVGGTLIRGIGSLRSRTGMGLIGSMLIGSREGAFRGARGSSGKGAAAGTVADAAFTAMLLKRDMARVAGGGFRHASTGKFASSGQALNPLGKFFTTGLFAGGGRMSAMRGAGAIPVIGQIILIISLLRPLGNMFRYIADSLGKLREKGGLLGILIKSLAIFFRVLETGINVILRLLGNVWDFIRKIGKKLHIDDLFSAMNKSLGAVEDFWDAAAGESRGNKKGSAPGDASGLVTPDLPLAPTNTANVNVYITDGSAVAMHDFQQAIASAFPTGRATVTTRRA